MSKVKSILEGDPPVVGASVNLATETAMVRVVLGGGDNAAAAAATAEEGRSSPTQQASGDHRSASLAVHLAEVRFCSEVVQVPAEIQLCHHLNLGIRLEASHVHPWSS